MPPTTAEVYTFPPNAQTPNAIAARTNCLCRFRGPGLECEQTNNRGQTAILRLDQYPDLLARYQRQTIPLGVCSVMDAKGPWIVCPNRLFYTGPASPLLEHSIYHSWGFNPGDSLAMWREVRINNKKRSKVFNYNFDYVFRRVIDAKKMIYDDVPFMIEVMSCSTSGGGISADFAEALGSIIPARPRGGPTLNKRQVLGRMMSQLVAKAEVVHNWGGKTIWIVQDLFWSYVNETTGFDMDEFRDDPNGNMVVIVRNLQTQGYDPADPQADCYPLRLDRLLRGWDRFERSRGENSVGRDFVSLLNAPFTPDRQIIVRKTTERPPTAIVTCAV
jgi:hypothetical protein